MHGFIEKCCLLATFYSESFFRMEDLVVLMYPLKLYY